jgi:hypothetical protein
MLFILEMLHENEAINIPGLIFLGGTRMHCGLIINKIQGRMFAWIDDE